MEFPNFYFAGTIDVIVRGPNGNHEKADVRFNDDDRLSYSVSYIPKLPGAYNIFVTFLGKDIPNSPFNVQVADSAGDISKVKTFGPGLAFEGNLCGKSTYFEITSNGTYSNYCIRSCESRHTPNAQTVYYYLLLYFNQISNFIRCEQYLDAGHGIPEVIILDPAGHKTTVPVKLRQIKTNHWRCEYISNIIGLHSVNVFFAGNPIYNSPFGVKISPGKITLLRHRSYSNN